MHAHRFLLVLTVLVAHLACRAGGEPAFVQLTEARRLVSAMRIDFTKGSDASDRAVLADTDEESLKFAHEADAATGAVQAAMPALTRSLTGLGHAGNVALLTRFQERFARHQTLDGEILKLAVENTNLKAQRLLFGPVGQAANAFCNGLRTLPAPAPANTACRFADAIARAQLAVREIQVLEAPHIAEANEREMDRLEGEMASRQSNAREALAAIERDSRPASRAQLDAAKAALDSFEAQSRKLIELSRKNTNVRSLELAMKQKPALTSACDESLAALQEALASQGFSGTR
jgi:hypothetical protein